MGALPCADSRYFLFARATAALPSGVRLYAFCCSYVSLVMLPSLVVLAWRCYVSSLLDPLRSCTSSACMQVVPDVSLQVLHTTSEHASRTLKVQQRPVD